jgi:hypothetical protein
LSTSWSWRCSAAITEYRAYPVEIAREFFARHWEAKSLSSHRRDRKAYARDGDQDDDCRDAQECVSPLDPQVRHHQFRNADKADRHAPESQYRPRKRKCTASSECNAVLPELESSEARLKLGEIEQVFTKTGHATHHAKGV